MSSLLLCRAPHMRSAFSILIVRTEPEYSILKVLLPFGIA